MTEDLSARLAHMTPGELLTVLTVLVDTDPDAVAAAVAMADRMTRRADPESP